MHSLSTILLPAVSILLLSTTATAAHGPYIPSGSGSLPHYPPGTAPYPTGTGYHQPPPFPTASGISLSSIPPSEAATTCPLPTTVTTTTQVTVTVTVPVGGGVVSTGTGTGTGVVGTGTGVVGPTASAGLKRRMEMRGLGEEMGRKERKRGFWA